MSRETLNGINTAVDGPAPCMGRFVVSGARVFDGECVLGVVDVHVVDGIVSALDAGPDRDVDVVDGGGATLVPGFIDAHTHSDSVELLQHALAFGVTTECDLASAPIVMGPLRQAAAERDDLADVRSASFGLTPRGGHPHQLLPDGVPPWPTASTEYEVAAFVGDRIAEGADYIKVHIEDGQVMRTSLPVIKPDLVHAAVREGHRRGKMVLAHAFTLTATELAIEAGIDGLAHLFIDQPPTARVVEKIAASGAFVIPTLSVLASLAGEPVGALLADDPRVASKLPPSWLDNLRNCWDTAPRAGLDYAMATVDALRDAGVDILAGTDAAHLGAHGVAHGASLHGELRLLVEAGFSPLEALRAATSGNARRFGLGDRGRVAVGKRADLLLIDGDPTVNITDTLSIRAMWRRGRPVDFDRVSAG